MHAGRERLWQLFSDMRGSAALLPGVESIEHVGGHTWRGTLKVRLGPFALRLHGRIVQEEQDRDAWRAAWSAQAEDRRIAGAARGTAVMMLERRNAEVTEIDLTIDINLLGGIGELGQPVVRPIIDRLLTRFFHNVSRELAGRTTAHPRPRY